MKIMKNDIFLSIVYFSALFLLLTLLLKPFQLFGANDSAFYLNVISNFIHNGQFGSFFECNTLEKSYLSAHFSPFWILFSPLFFLIDDPITLVYILYYLGYLFWFVTSFYIIKKHLGLRDGFLPLLAFFLLFFSSVTVLFNYSLNYNGLHEVLFAVGFLNIAYYQLLIRNNVLHAFLWYIPTLLIKEEFLLLFIFFNIILYLQSRKNIFIISTVLSGLLFYYVYVHFMPSMLGGLQASHAHTNYRYLFQAESVSALFQSIIQLPGIPQKLFQITTFFVPFLVISRFWKMSRIDVLIAILAIGPTVGYNFLTTHIGQSNFLFDHYALPIFSVVFVLTVKYLIANKGSLIRFLATNILLIAIILSFKAAWQYRYYMDEEALYTEIMPKLALHRNDMIVTDERTAFYFSLHSQTDYFMSLRKCTSPRTPRYILLNMRYLYLTKNSQKHTISTYELLSGFDTVLSHYGVLYKKYPFVLYGKDTASDMGLLEDELDEWDQLTRKDR